MKRFRIWHLLLGHGHPRTPHVFDPDEWPAEEVALRACIVREECSCGAQWVFNAMTFTETYVPAEDP
jgi:hypothetical protein